MRKKKGYQGIVDQGRSVGFRKVNSTSEIIRSSLERIRVQIFCVRTRLKVFADEEKAGYKIGEMIRVDARKNLDKYKSPEGLVTQVRIK
jgi:hypothetical protein